MNRKEHKRAVVLGKVDRGEITAVEAGEVTGLSERHVWRLLAEYRRDGPKAFAHGNRSRKPHHALNPTLGSRVVDLYRDKYAGFNHLHFSEKLDGEGIHLSYSSVHRILVKSGIKSPRKRRSPKHRKRRERKPQRGMMLQIDGSHHDWLQGRGPKLTLIGAIDDATGEVPYAEFRAQEDAQGYFLLLRHVITQYGIPMSVYSDQHGIFVCKRKELLSLEEELKGEREPTQFGRLLRELEIQPIFALSPQAKGRIERLWETFQDRLVSELRLVGARTMEEANRVLQEFLFEFNRKFVVDAAQAGSAYRQIPANIKPSEVFCFKYERTVANDNTVQLDRKVIQIPPGPGGRSYAKARVRIHEGMDGSLGVFYQGKRIAYEAAPEGLPVLRVKRRGKSRVDSEPVAGTAIKKKDREVQLVKAARSDPWRPAADHPWRRPIVLTKSQKN